MAAMDMTVIAAMDLLAMMVAFDLSLRAANGHGCGYSGCSTVPKTYVYTYVLMYREFVAGESL